MTTVQKNFNINKKDVQEFLKENARNTWVKSKRFRKNS